ncbi:MAG TPA: CFI-box-CTERM domain-containing protein [Tepidisphaeraceae bacterium]|jgi:hypothetical protein|nr:CFI-box-CTERM domain-containing protein [Tepidisphaeraceae bacterium]
MAYTNNVTLLDTEGGSSSDADITSRVWMLWFVVGTGTGTGNLQSQEGLSMGLVKKDLSAPLQISFPGNTNFAYASRSVGLSVQDTNRVANDMGWLFRSDQFPDDLPAAPIEIITASRTFPSAEVATMLPALPITVDAGTTTVITFMTTSLASATTLVPGGIDFAATGTTHATGVIVSFSYSGRIILSPSSDVRAASMEAINVGLLNPVITFAPGPSILSAIEASLLNSLRIFIVHEFQPKIRQTLESRVNAAIVAQAGTSLPGGSLPAGVILSIRSIRITAVPPGGTTLVLEVRGALGAFGGVFSKLPPVTISPCFIATAVHGADSQEVQLLRSFRDDFLANNFAGRAFVSLYESASPGLARFISARPNLRSIARAVIVTPGVWLAKLSSKIRHYSKKGRRIEDRSNLGE